MKIIAYWQVAENIRIIKKWVLSIFFFVIIDEMKWSSTDEQT